VVAPSSGRGNKKERDVNATISLPLASVDHRESATDAGVHLPSEGSVDIACGYAEEDAF
jgi:hypothetical protein